MIVHVVLFNDDHLLLNGTHDAGTACMQTNYDIIVVG